MIAYKDAERTLGQNVRVVGGGASGMFCAYYLLKSGRNVTLYEKSNRLGGIVETTRGQFGLYEHAANSLLLSPELEDLCQDIGVELLTLKRSEKYILKEGRLRRMPLSMRGLLRAMWGYFWVRSTHHNLCPADMYGAMRFYFGDELASSIADAMATGIYGCSARELEMRIAMPQMLPDLGMTMSQHFRRRKKAGLSSKRVVVYPKGGMSVLTDRLALYLRERLKDRIHLNTAVDRFHPTQDEVWCVPSYVLATLPGQDIFSTIRYSSLKCFGLALPSSVVRSIPKTKGLGCLVPGVEGRRILGVLYSSSSFPSRALQDHVEIWTCMTHLETTYSQLWAELRSMYGIQVHPLEWREFSWPRAIPIYDRQLAQVLEYIKTGLPSNVHVVSNWSGEVSLRGMLSQARRLSLKSL